MVSFEAFACMGVGVESAWVQGLGFGVYGLWVGVWRVEAAQDLAFEVLSVTVVAPSRGWG